MKEIPLSQGKVALVDDEEYGRLSQNKWYARKSRNTYYASRMSPHINGKRHQIQMHRVIMMPQNGMETDHINGNGLDNRRGNLRLVSIRENAQNRHEQKTSKFVGVHWVSSRKKWEAQIHFNKKGYILGQYPEEETAATVYAVAYEVLNTR